MEIVGRNVEIITDENRIRPEKSEVNRLLADNRLIYELTGWKSQVPFKDGLSRTVEWIRKNINYFEVGAYSQ
jgi:nucleoside-diphosphate-sugar epimerase